jgi:hypothetical protein
MIRMAAIALSFATAMSPAAAQTSPGTVPPASVATAPPPVATAPPQPITGPSVRVPSTSPLPPVSTGNAASNTTAAPGASSFTEAEARSRIEAHGYSDVTGLQKDAHSVWRGTATKNGQTVGVALDYQGNILSQ